MPSTTVVEFQRIYRPFCVLSPISITMASTSFNALSKSTIFRIYIVVSLTSASVFSWQRLLDLNNDMLYPFNTKGATFVHWILYFVLTAYLVATVGKRRIEKLKSEIQELDVLLQFSEKSSVVMMTIHNAAWIAYFFVFHVGVVVSYIVVRVGIGMTEKDYESYIRPVVGFSLVDFVMISEVACFSCFTTLLYIRMKYFVSYLNVLLVGEDGDKDLNVIPCYRQIHRVLKRVEKAFHVQVTIVIAFNFYSGLRVFLALMKNHMELDFYTNLNVVITVRYIFLFVTLGVLGEGIAAQLRRVRVLAMFMELSAEERLQSLGARLSAEVEVRPRGLTAAGGSLHARLPLRILAALAAALILMLQLGVNLER